jgi:hypothetical protein
MILLLTARMDSLADHLETKLRERGAEVARFAPAQFPSQAELSLTYGAGRVRYTLRVGNEFLDLNRLKSIWFCPSQPPVASADVSDNPTRNYVEEECKTFVEGAWNCLDCLWLPAPPVVAQRAHKAVQLKVAGELGFELPATLLSNSPNDFLEFYHQNNGNVVSKLASSTLGRSFDHQFGRYTEVVSKRDVGYAQTIRFCPLIFQAYVPKRVELRITIVGQKVFAAEIHSQGNNRTRHDWRRYDSQNTSYRPHELPPEIASRCVQLVKRLGLCYGAVDMVLTPDGRYVFLEINLHGQYLWIEEATKLAISDAICDLLISGPSENE